MHLRHAAASALLFSSSLLAQRGLDFSTATPIAGTWNYSSTSDGTEARFIDSTSNPQLIIHCTRETRIVAISRPAVAASPALDIWTSSEQRSIPSIFNAATGRLTIALSAGDPILDAMSNSRGRIAVVAGTQPALVLPPWPELARVIEDCRA
ncbi:MAG TPA: hypothetical protein VE968_09860 [Sphingomicrobium sp.]|nr:hypothetical protein [Sphingomicrobium sp.]